MEERAKERAESACGCFDACGTAPIEAEPAVILASEWTPTDCSESGSNESLRANRRELSSQTQTQQLRATSKTPTVVDTIGIHNSSSAIASATSSSSTTKTTTAAAVVVNGSVPEHLKPHAVNVQRVSDSNRSSCSTSDETSHAPTVSDVPEPETSNDDDPRHSATTPATAKTTTRHGTGWTGLKAEPPARGFKPKRVVVCGAGIVGLTTCYYLVKQGHEVVCVDKEAEVGTQVSFCNGAFLDPSMYGSWANLSMLMRIRSSYHGESLAASKVENPIDPIGVDEASRLMEQHDSISNNQPMASSSIQVMSGPSAGDDDDPLDSSSIKPNPSTRSSWTQPFLSRTRSFFNHKPMKIELNALRDLRFWTWGYHFLLNSGSKRAHENGRLIRQLGYYSMDKLRELQHLYGHEALQMDQTATGTIELVDNKRHMQLILASDRIKHLDELCVPYEVLNSHRACKLEPSLRPQVYAPGALFSPTGTNGDVHKMCVALHQVLRQEGVMFRFQTEIHEILPVGNRVVALQTTSGALIEADDFVVALGNATAPLVQRAGIKLPIYPVKGYVLSVPVNDRYLPPKHNIFANGRVLVSPLGSTLRISGGVDFGKRMESSERVDWLLQQATRLFPEGFLDTDRLEQHVCWRPVTADDVPLIGRTKLSNLYVNAGHGSKGWTFAFGAGALLADEISGLKPQIDLVKFSPQRFGLFR